MYRVTVPVDSRRVPFLLNCLHPQAGHSSVRVPSLICALAAPQFQKVGHWNDCILNGVPGPHCALLLPLVRNHPCAIAKHQLDQLPIDNQEREIHHYLCLCKIHPNSGPVSSGGFTASPCRSHACGTADLYSGKCAVWNSIDSVAVHSPRVPCFTVSCCRQNWQV